MIPSLAQSEYQSWLLTLVTEVGLLNPSVDPQEVMNQNDLMYVLRFSLRGRGSTEQMTELLYRFYEAGHLHQITSMSMNPLSATKQLDVTLGIEALALRTANRADRSSDEPSVSLASNTVGAYREIARRDLFRLGDADEVARQTQLTAITSDNAKKWAAWFSDVTGKTRILHVGDQIKTNRFVARIIEISGENVSIEMEQVHKSLRVGQFLIEAADVP